MSTYITTPFLIVIFAVIILGGVVLLLTKVYSEVFLKVKTAFPFSTFRKKDKRLHHYWFVGY